MFADWSMYDFVYWLMLVAAGVNLVVLAHNLWTTRKLRRTSKKLYEQIDKLTAARARLDEQTAELDVQIEETRAHTEHMKTLTARMEHELNAYLQDPEAWVAMFRLLFTPRDGERDTLH